MLVVVMVATMQNGLTLTVDSGRPDRMTCWSLSTGLRPISGLSDSPVTDAGP